MTQTALVGKFALYIGGLEWNQGPPVSIASMTVTVLGGKYATDLSVRWELVKYLIENIYRIFNSKSLSRGRLW